MQNDGTRPPTLPENPYNPTCWLIGQPEIPPYSLVVGVPARVVRDLRDEIDQWSQSSSLSDQKSRA
jgi:carbonic anhydrase/acetyltransferase-like protein (isoleucine patch superfamily)